MIIKYIGKIPYEDGQKRFVLNYGDLVELAEEEALSLLKSKAFRKGDDNGTGRENRGSIPE